MIIRPVYQTKHVQVEMTRQEVDNLKAFYVAVEQALKWGQYLIKGTPELNALWKAQKKAPMIIEEGHPGRPK